MSTSEMFNTISPTYDRVNRILSAGIDRYWRKQVAKKLKKKPALYLLDCATGTGDQLFSLMDHLNHTIAYAVGLDPAAQMLDIGRAKLRRKPYAHRATLVEGCMTAIPYPDQVFDTVTLSFGLRNSFDIKASLKEMFRVLSPQGQLLILEFSLPSNLWIRQLYLLYLRHLVPFVGGLFSKRKEAYQYLNQSIEQFPSPQSICSLLQEIGFISVELKPLTFGIVTLYIGIKP